MYFKEFFAIDSMVEKGAEIGTQTNYLHIYMALLSFINKPLITYVASQAVHSCA